MLIVILMIAFSKNTSTNNDNNRITARIYIYSIRPRRHDPCGRRAPEPSEPKAVFAAGDTGARDLGLRVRLLFCSGM